MQPPIFEDAATRTSIGLLLDPRIRDTFVAESSSGLKDVRVTDFRRTLVSAATSAFPHAEVVDVLPQHGVALTLVDFRPLAVKQAAIVGNGYTNYEVGCEMTYGVSLHRGGTVKNITGKVHSRGSTGLAAQMGAVCADGLAVAFEEIRHAVAVELEAAK